MTPPISDERRRSAQSVAYNATIAELREIHEDLRVFRIRPDSGPLRHEPGQYATLGLRFDASTLGAVPDRVEHPVAAGQIIKRAYSISSPILDPRGELFARDATPLELYITLVREDNPRVPSLTSRLFARAAGERVWLDPRARGSYTLAPVAPADAVLFLATGTGEAPHNAMLHELLLRRHEGPVASVVSVRRHADLGYLDVHRALEARGPRYRYVPLVTRESSRREHIQDLLAAGDRARRLGFEPHPATTHVFVCGNPAMVGTGTRQGGGVSAQLAAEGFTPGRNLHFERYW